MNDKEFMQFIATKLFSTRQYPNPFYIRMYSRCNGKTENRKRLLKNIIQENLKIFNECNYSLESETVMIGKIKIKGRKYYDRLSNRPGNV